MTIKPPLLFLHGAFAGPEVWTRFVAPWFEGRGHDVATPRLPGALETRPRLRDHVRAARAAADALGGRPVVIGHSLGGLVAQHLAAEGRAAGVVLVASPGPFGLASSLAQLCTSAPDVFAAMMALQTGSAAPLDRALVRRALFTEQTPDAWIDAVGLVPAAEPVGPLLDGLLWDLPVWAGPRRVPMLALLGDRDVFVPLADLWTIAALYGAETEVLRGRGHGLPLDRAWRSLVRRIDAWLDAREARGPAPRPVRIAPPAAASA